MAQEKLSATIFIPTYNGERTIRQVLNSVFSQKLPLSYEVFIIDSGSSDRTLEIIGEFPKVRLYQIPNSEFGHGKTRNLAARMSSSTFMAYITQDAIPASPLWLHNILEPFFINEKISAVLGKQIPWPDCNATIKREVSEVFNSFGDSDSIVLYRRKSILDSLTKMPSSSFLSDVNAAYRRKLLIGGLPFREVDYAEDQAMGEAVLEAGLIKAYSPMAVVNHSHNFSVREYFYRKYDEYMGLKSLGHLPKMTVSRIIFGSLKATFHDYLFIIKDQDYSPVKKLWQFILAPLYNLSIRSAIYAAGHSKARANKISLEARNKTKSPD